MNYKELKDRLTKCEYTLKMFKNGTLVDKDKKTVRELKILKESLHKQMKEIESKEIDVFGYQTKHFHVCPGATSLFKRIIPKTPEKMQDMIVKLAKHHDILFAIEIIALKSQKAAKKYLDKAIEVASDIYVIGGKIGLDQNTDLSYIQNHLEIINNAARGEVSEEEGVIFTDDEMKAKKLAKDGARVKLTSEGPHQTTYVKVARSDYKKAMGILDSNIDPTYAKMDVVDDDGDGNVIIYFNFRAKDDGEPGEDPAEFIYDLSMDLEANGISIVDKSHDVDEAKDINDPVLMKLRALQSRMAKKKAIVKGGERHTGKKRAILSKLQTKRDQVMRDMEQEAEPEGGPIADKYGDMLNKIDAAIAKAKGTKPKSYDDTFNEGQDDIFALGYDLDATQYLVDYLKSKYKEGQDYELHIGRGDTHPNAVTLINPEMEQDEELGNLLMNAGDNEETDYQSGREAEKDYIGEKKRPGLWANIRAKRARGEKPAHKNSNAHKDAVKAGNKIKEEDVNLSKEHLSIIASKAGKAIVQAVHASGDEVSKARIKKVFSSALSPSIPEAFTVHIIYKNDSEVSYRFQIDRNKLIFLADGEDIILSDVGVKPSGEPFINTELVKNEMAKYFKQMQEKNEQDIEQKFDDRGKPTHLGHRLSDKDRATLAKIANMIKNANREDYDYNEGTADDIAEEYTKEKLLAYLGQADDAMIRTYDDKYLIIYNPKNGNDDNAAMWHDDTVFGVDQDGQEHEVRYNQIDGLQLEDINEESELDKITKAKRLIKQQAPAMNKLPQDDPKRKAFIDKVKQINQKHKELLDKEDDKISGTGRDQELDEGRGDFDDVLKAIQNMSNNDDISERDAAAEIVLALADKFQLPVDKNLEDYMQEDTNEYGSSQGAMELDTLFGALGYRDGFDDFIEDNPGAVEALHGWISSIPEFRKKLGAEFSNSELEDMGMYDIAGYDDEDDDMDEAEAKPIPDTILRGYNANVKNAQSMATALLSLFNQINSKEPTDFTANGNIKRVIKLLNYVAKTPDTETDQGGEQTADGLDEASNSIRTPAYDQAREQFFDYLERTLDATYRNASKGATAKKLLKDPNQEEFITQQILPAILKRDDQPFSATFKQQMLGDENLRRDFVRVAMDMYPEHRITPDAVNPDGSEFMGEAGPGFAHDCAAKVVHEKYGKGNCIPEKHTLVKEGEKHVVTHYDVLFEGGKTVKDIPVSELDIKTSNEHWHKGYKKKKK